MPNYKPRTTMPDVVKEYLRNIMIQNKIESIHMSFCGSGDDGQIDNVEYQPQNLALVGDDIITIPEDVVNAMSGFNGWYLNDRTARLEEVVQGIIHHWLDECPVDWVNGDGGSGTCDLYIKNNKLTIEIAAHEWVQEEGPLYKCKL